MALPNKTTIVVATYRGDPWQDHIIKTLEALGYRYLLVDKDRNDSFSVNNNRGAKMAKTKYVLFLNSDTKPTPGFLEEMESVLDKNKHFGVVGAQLRFMKDMVHKVKFKNKENIIEGKKGLIQHAGIRFNKKLLPVEFGMYSDPKNPDVSKPSLVVAVTGACMLIRRKEFLDIGGFDEKFKNGWEDTDLCLRYLTEKNKMVYYQPKAVVEHYVGGGASMGRYLHEDDNFNRWYKKWHLSKKLYKQFVEGYDGGSLKLNIGCGSDVMDGFVGVDVIPSEAALMNVDIGHFDGGDNGFFFADNTVDEVYLKNILHLVENTIGVMNEMHRILNSEGWLTITVPHANSWMAWVHPSAKKGFVPETFLEYFKADRLEEHKKLDNEAGMILPWHIEHLDPGKIPDGVDAFGVSREILVKMRPLKL